jgi:hypothetical protein
MPRPLKLITVNHQPQADLAVIPLPCQMDTLFVKAKDQILALHYFNTGTSSCASKARRSPSLRNTYFQNRIQSPIHTQDRRT